ncbi:MAG: tol-pal system protein YbgF [Myxococcales bacterium]|nr:tol-pal system protein YbgF [Myxococcales bacterium]
MGTRIFALGICAALLPGCGETISRAELTDVRQRLDAEQKRSASAQHKVDELENRVFLLTDQVESQKVASLHRTTRTLPVVTLKPDAVEPAADAADEVGFEGAARSNDPDHTRPVFRIDNSRPGAHRAEPVAHKTEAAPRKAEPVAHKPVESSSDSDDNLGVAPVPPIRGSASAPAERSAPAVEPLTLYRAAYEELRAGRHDSAEAGFRDFVRRFPHHDYADNAQYWLGECFYDQKRYDKAAPEFRAVVQRWPTGNKAPDALVKLGFSLIALGEIDKGRQTLREVPTAYPRTEAARLAAERLAQLTPTEGSK